MNGIKAVRFRHTKLLANLIMAATFGFLSTMMPSCEPDSATVTLVGPPDLTMQAWPATDDGKRSDGPPVAESSDATLTLAPGCWVLAVDYGPTGQARSSNYDHSRPYVGTERHQQHAVCLDPGENFLLDVGVRWGGFPASLSQEIYFVTQAGDVIADDVTLTVERFDGPGDSVVEELTVVSGVADLSSALSQFCYTVVSVDHPQFTFPGALDRTTCNPEVLPETAGSQIFDADFFAVGYPVGQTVDPSQLVVNLESSAVGPVRYDIEIQANASSEKVQLALFALEQQVFELPTGCYTVRLIPGRDYMLADVSRALRFYDVCLTDGNETTIESGDVVLSNVDGSVPFFPIVATDAAGDPVVGVQVDFFYPGEGLTPDDLRAFDHSAGDSRGVFYDSAVTDSGGRALMPNYTECMVATAIAPPGFSFDTDRFQRSTVCEGDSVTLGIDLMTELIERRN